MMLQTPISTSLPVSLPERFNTLTQNMNVNPWATRAVNFFLKNDLTAVEAYQYGQGMGKLSQHFGGHASQHQQSFLDHLLALVDWWSESDLGKYGWLVIDHDCYLEPFISLQVIRCANIKTKQTHECRDFSFYAGLISGFFSNSVGGSFDVVQPSYVSPEQNPDSCQFFLGHQDSLNAIQYWQTLDTLR